MTLNDYAALSARVYNDARDPVNRNPRPPGWEEIAYTSDLTNSLFTGGFTAGAYKNSETGEIVIAYKGTDFLYGTNSGQSNADWLANFGLGIGVGSSQALAAARFYAEIKAANPDANITFTGHSLGGGLASIMSVWFNRPATVFAEAPFEPTAV
ncbi:MAG: lipase family protein, partial [Candidatus Binatia bacterium]